jgi:hypothetical protein
VEHGWTLFWYSSITNEQKWSEIVTSDMAFVFVKQSLNSIRRSILNTEPLCLLIYLSQNSPTRRTVYTVTVDTVTVDTVTFDTVTVDTVTFDTVTVDTVTVGTVTVDTVTFDTVTFDTVTLIQQQLIQ